MLGKLIKFLIFLGVIGFIGLVIYAYAAPFVWGGDVFAPPQVETRIPVTLEAD